LKGTEGRRKIESTAVTLTFETLGNATIQFCVDGEPILATDPWLVGTCYFGSWALDHALSDEQIRRARESQYIWISHGHPDHLHPDSLRLLPKEKKILIPDHYDRDIADFLTSQGFAVEILTYRTWRRLHPQLEVLCIDNENQDAILIARFGESLVIDLNDSPFFGEQNFIRSLVAKHPNDKVFVLQLCSIDADMRNFVDQDGRRTIQAPQELKPGAIWEVARGVERLGAKYFCCSSSQHLYVRSDSIWSNPYRITYDDIEQNWSRPEIKLVPPFVTMDVATGTFIENHPSRQSDISQITDETGNDDWNVQLSDDEWLAVERFVNRFKLLRRYIDFLEITVGGQTRRFATRSHVAAKAEKANGITFIVPRRSLLEAITHGYFDDLLIGNFMMTRLHGRATLYPFVTPVIAKLGGNAKVLNYEQYVKFCWRYFSRNPIGFLKWRLERSLAFDLQPSLRRWAIRLGMFEPLKRFYRGWYLQDPVTVPSAAQAVGHGTTAGFVQPNESARPSVFPGRQSFIANANGQHSKLTADRPEFSNFDRPRIIISIDTEEDFDWSAPFSPQSKAVHSMSRQHLGQQVLERYGVKPIYLCDFPIADQEAAYRWLRELNEAGRCEIGAQLHPWVNPPQIEEVNERNSFLCNLPLDLQRAKLRALTERLTETLGVRPTVYKAGRHGADASLPDLLKPLGYKVDMSFNPIRDYRPQGGPDHTCYPHTPFWLDQDRQLLSIPLTANVMGALRGDWLRFSDLVWSRTAERFKMASIFRRLNLMNRVALTPEGIPLREAKQLTHFLIEGGHRIFSLCYHSTSLTPGSTPYVRNEKELRRFLGWLDSYLEFFTGEMNGMAVQPMEVYADACCASVTREPAA
jgi:hypothetical protein